MRCRWGFGPRLRPLLVGLLFALSVGMEVSAERSFTGSIPNGTLNDSNTRGDGCGHCHVLPGSKARNVFGARWKSLGWGPKLAGEDSDGDGVTNGWELGDPQGTWQKGSSDPGDATFVTSPGQAGSVPPVLAVAPLEVAHSERQGENLRETFVVENVGGDCFGNPIGACSLDIDVSASDAWMDVAPAVAQLLPLEIENIDILFTTGGLLGDYEGSATISAPGIWNAPQEVLVPLSVPEPKTFVLQAAALLVVAATRKSFRRNGVG